MPSAWLVIGEESIKQTTLIMNNTTITVMETERLHVLYITILPITTIFLLYDQLIPLHDHWAVFTFPALVSRWHSTPAVVSRVTAPRRQAEVYDMRWRSTAAYSGRATPGVFGMPILAQTT